MTSSASSGRVRGGDAASAGRVRSRISRRHGLQLPPRRVHHCDVGRNRRHTDQPVLPTDPALTGGVQTPRDRRLALGPRGKTGARTARTERDRKDCLAGVQTTGRCPRTSARSGCERRSTRCGSSTPASTDWKRSPPTGCTSEWRRSTDRPVATTVGTKRATTMAMQTSTPTSPTPTY